MLRLLGSVGLLLGVGGGLLAEEALTPASTQPGRLRFERMEIAQRSGDVKLVGDIDGDGTNDLVLGGMPGDALRWWHWPDLASTLIAVPSIEFTTDGELSDIDGDGDLDIITADGRDGTNLVWFENPRPSASPADGAAWKRHAVMAAGDWVKDVEVADFDGDGRKDIALRTPTTLMIVFQIADGDWQAVAFADVSLGEEGMTIGDVDADGDTDVVVCGQWLRNPGGARARDSGSWTRHDVGAFDVAFKAVVVDIDKDGRPDILTSSSEHTADVAWFSAERGATGTWSRHVIRAAVPGAHTLQAADMDGDGSVDVVVGQMHTTAARELAIYFNKDGSGESWSREVIDNVGLHNGVAADIDADGDLDIYGSNWVGNPPLRIWINNLDPHSSCKPETGKCS
ncbi:MAG: VCBS repeat-containing protein [Hyphomicrobium sp.]|jgi:hypothetical protein